MLVRFHAFSTASERHLRTVTGLARRGGRMPPPSVSWPSGLRRTPRRRLNELDPEKSGPAQVDHGCVDRQKEEGIKPRGGSQKVDRRKLWCVGGRLDDRIGDPEDPKSRHRIDNGRRESS